MACILKFPLQGKKGVVTFTTQEQSVINKSERLRDAVVELHKYYIVGLHFNWHNFNFSPDPLYDFFMAGKEDLRPAVDHEFRLVPMDACNFTPQIYKPSCNEKYWDVLAVGNPVFFKRPEVVLKTIRSLFDESPNPLRALYICPMPKRRFSDLGYVFYDIRTYYEALFTKEERTRFTLLTTNFNSPFPFDRQTLSVFFRNSKVFLHGASDERRCRIAAYAWCAGLPVVAYSSVGSILPEELRTQPGYFEVEDDSQYVPSLMTALDSYRSFGCDDYRRVLSEECTVDALEQELHSVFSDMRIPYSESQLLHQNLDIRLGWHHNGIGGRTNGLMQSLDDFIRLLISMGDGLASHYSINALSPYPERILAGEDESYFDGDLLRVERDSPYLNRKKLVTRIQGVARGLYRAVASRLKY